MTVKEILVDSGYEDAIVLDGTNCDKAFIGVSYDGRAVYDYELLVECLMTSDGMEEYEAVDWIDYNMIRALPYYGENAPIILYPIAKYYSEEW